MKFNNLPDQTLDIVLMFHSAKLEFKRMIFSSTFFVRREGIRYLTVLQMEMPIAKNLQEWCSTPILTCTGDHPTTDPWVYDGIIQILIARKQHCKWG